MIAKNYRIGPYVPSWGDGIWISVDYFDCCTLPFAWLSSDHYYAATLGLDGVE